MLGKLHRLIDVQETKQTFAQDQSSKDTFRTVKMGNVMSCEAKNSGFSRGRELQLVPSVIDE